METIDLGNVAIISKGIHNKILAYERLNEVKDEVTQNWYRAKKNVPEQVELDNEEYWELVRDNTNVGGDENVQSDWNQTDYTADDYIKNKPDVGDENVQSDWNQTDYTADDYIKNKPDVGDENVQSDWNQTDTTADDYIKNKPDVGDENVQSDWNQEDTEADDYIKNKPSIEANNYRNITTNITANMGDILLVDTTNNTLNITLPATPSNGDSIEFIDIKSNFDTNNLTIARNGNLIMGTDEDMTVDIKNISFKLKFLDNNWRVV